MTDSLLKIEPLLPLWLCLLLFGGGLAMTIWLELQRPLRYKAFRIASAVMLCLSLLGILLQPKIRKEDHNFSILVTGDASNKVLDSLNNSYPGASMLYLGNEKAPGSLRKLSSTNEIANEKINVVVGNGLSPSAADLLSETNFNYVPSAFPDGIIQLALPNEVKVSIKSSIHGVLNDNVDSVKIVLESPGGKEDSVTLTKNGIQKFKLDFTPRQAGTFLYSISIAEKKELIPIKVERENQLKILVVQMFPTFETGYLKNLLGKDHQLVFRYQLSKNNFRYEYINHRSIRTDRLAADMLNSFDLLIIDSDELGLLSGAERKNIEASVMQGLGILVLPNQTPVGNRAMQSLLTIEFKPVNTDTANFALNTAVSLPAWSAQAQNTANIIPVIQNKNRILAGYVYQGFGKIGFNLLQETYKLKLEGDSASYKSLWTSLAQKTARSEMRNFQIRVKNNFPLYPKEPVVVEVIGSSPQAPTLLHNGEEISMSEDLIIDDRWITKIWPENSGWHELQIKSDSAKHSFYVSEDSAWQSLATANSILKTKTLASSTPVTASPTWEYKRFGLWIYYMMFLVAALVLWVVPKI